jgi:replicative DNA helicase
MPAFTPKGSNTALALLPSANTSTPDAPSILGLQLIRSILEEKSVLPFFDLRPDQLLAHEHKVYLWVRKFHQQYHQLPSVQAVETNGMELPEISEPLAYYQKRVYNRARYNLMNAYQAKLAVAMAAQDMDAAEDISRAQSAALTALKNPESYTPLGALAHKVKDEYYVSKNTPGLLGITSGYETLDYQTAGFQKGDLVVIVARPGMGKTWLQLAFAQGAWRAGKKVAVLTMEMINEALVRRWVGLDAHLNPDLIRRGQLDIHGEKILTQTINSYDKADNVWFMSGNFDKNVDAVEDMIVQLAPDIVFIDAGYLLTPSNAQGLHGSELNKAVIHQLKQLANKYHITICITVQFNREVINDPKLNKGTRFELRTIGGTDAVGQDADIVMGIKLPEMPFTNSHRIVEVMKLREGSPKDFAINFSFWPMMFDEVPLESITEIPDEDDDGDDPPPSAAEKKADKAEGWGGSGSPAKSKKPVWMLR